MESSDPNMTTELSKSMQSRHVFLETKESLKKLFGATESEQTLVDLRMGSCAIKSQKSNNQPSEHA